MMEEQSQDAPIPNASLVRRKNKAGEVWSGTRLRVTPTCELEVFHALVVDQDEVVVDPFIFNPDYSAASQTGMAKVWDGSWTILRMLRDDPESELAKQCRSGAVCLELGSGSGLVGLAAAALGGHVLLTDVPTVAENSLQPNIDSNATINTKFAVNATLAIKPNTL